MYKEVVESAINHLTGKWLRSRKYAAIRLPKARALLTRVMEDGNFDKFIYSRSPKENKHFDGTENTVQPLNIRSISPITLQLDYNVLQEMNKLQSGSRRTYGSVSWFVAYILLYGFVLSPWDD
ncbi:hypothetical protein Tco_1121242 [Tanacetum coccineum]|uniref:Uncharacterized protein n=1 Tax=Tanacetum coccineum TaxID=301880 RepID=A0ABQ5IX49_9ASTR